MPGIVIVNQVPVELFDASGNPVLVQDGQAIPANTKSILLAGKDGTTARNLELESDGGNYRVRTGAKLAAGSNLAGKFQLRNPGDSADLGDAANPLRTDPTGSTTQPVSASSLPLPTGAATEATLTTIDSVLDSIKDTDGIKKITDPLPAGSNNIGDVDVVSSALPTGAATEATLSAVDGKLATIDGVLDSIKDTDGIKKITDQLPAGTNEIGKVAQGTKALPANAWPEYLVDSSGNVLGVVLDGSIYRLQTDSKIGKGASSLVHLDAIDTSSGSGRLKTTLYSQDGDAIAFGSVAPNPESIKNEFATTGTPPSPDLLVNGSVTPVVFTYDADPDHDISVLEVKFVLASNSVTFGTGNFGARAGPLPVGLKVEVTSDGNTGTVAILTRNECFVGFASPGGFEWVVSSKDMMSALWLVGGGLKLKAGSADNIKITVQDDLSAAGVYFQCFVKGNLLA